MSTTTSTTIPARVRTALDRAGLTLAEAATLPDDDLYRVRDLGRKGVEAVRRAAGQVCPACGQGEKGTMKPFETWDREIRAEEEARGPSPRWQTLADRLDQEEQGDGAEAAAVYEVTALVGEGSEDSARGRLVVYVRALSQSSARLRVYAMFRSREAVTITSTRVLP